MSKSEKHQYYKDMIDGTFLLKMRHIISENYYIPYSVPALCQHTGVSQNVFYRLQTGKITSNVELASVFALCDKLGLSPFDFAKTELKEKMLLTWLKKLEENGIIQYDQIEKILAFSNLPTEHRKDFIEPLSEPSSDSTYR